MKRPWMPFYVADYLTATGHLNTTQHGAYVLLILHYWRTGGLPDDDRQLANITRLPLRIWQDIRPIIQDFFFDGWKHDRVERELAECERISLAGKKAGEASGRTRRTKNVANDRSTISERSANDLPTTHTHKEQKEQEALSVSVKSKTRKIALPSDFRLSDTDAQFALSKGWTPAYLQSEFERFCDYATAHNRRYANWSAAWRNWVTSPYQKPNIGGRNERLQTVSPLIAAGDALVARTRADLAAFSGEGELFERAGTAAAGPVPSRRGQ